jgi:hypothetical protein
MHDCAHKKERMKNAKKMKMMKNAKMMIEEYEGD